MKKLLLSTIVILVIILTGITIAKGFEIGGLKVLGLVEIKEKDEQLDEKVKQATKLASTDYQKKIDDLNGEVKRLETKKQEYEDRVNVSTESEVEAANQIYFSAMDFLWTQIGNHAKSEGVGIEVVARNIIEVKDLDNKNLEPYEKKYTSDIYFTVTGSYVGIEEFITDIEDDTKLGYKIEDFRMITSSENGNTVQATFNCKNIGITGITTGAANTTAPTTDTTNNNTTENKTSK